MTILNAHLRGLQPLTVLLRAAIIALALATAWIHTTLGGRLFLLNAVGFAAFAVAMVVPGPIGRLRWLTRYAFVGFTAATIGAWLLFGARFDLAYLAKGIEVALIGLLLIESWWVDGGPIATFRRVVRIAAAAVR
jgi:hypothetical protein